ncbi:tRNA1(Val) (adenine(37)-N6)-methyltransferase [Aerococcaceae bacterium DSM 111020]|nr:tRNA1(Val) (adenine(37)-N6)-methyltransferase [Aerococcaceae bacterium DSM 111020]
MKPVDSLLMDDERIDRLSEDGVCLIQSSSYFTMSIDAVLLADFIDFPTQSHRQVHYLDFCTGNGVIPLLLTRKTKQPLLGIDIQGALIDMAKRSAILNDVQNQVTFIEQDILNYQRPRDVLYDIISCNPPYFIVDDSREVHQRSSHAIARHEIYLTMDQWVSKAKSLLKTKGKLYIVHRPNRLDDLFEALNAHQFSIHRLKFIYPKPESQANAVLIEAIAQGGRRGVKVESPLIVHNLDNTYTKEMLAIYRGEK